MATYAFDPSNFTIGDTLADLPFEQVIGSAVDQFEIVDDGSGNNILRVDFSVAEDNVWLHTGPPHDLQDAEVYLNGIFQYGSERNRFFTWCRFESGAGERRGYRGGVEVSDASNDSLAQTLYTSNGQPADHNSQQITMDIDDHRILATLSGGTHTLKQWAPNDGIDEANANEIQTSPAAVSDLNAGGHGFGISDQTGTSDIYFIGIGTAGDAAPRETGTIAFQGTNAVEDANGNPVDGATVYAQRPGVAEAAGSATTDANGEASITGLDASTTYRTWAEFDTGSGIQTSQVQLRTTS